MRVVFLDFDGVVVPFGKASLSDKAVATASKNFQKFLDKDPSIKIVISSAWRQHGIGYCKRFLEGLGIDVSRIVGLTDNERGSRGYQIQCYLKRNPEVKQFVIVDDTSDMGDLTHKLVKTNSFIGFTEGDIEKALEMINQLPL